MTVPTLPAPCAPRTAPLYKTYEFHASLGYLDLREAVETWGAGHDFTCLVPDLSGQLPPHDAPPFPRPCPPALPASRQPGNPEDAGCRDRLGYRPPFHCARAGPLRCMPPDRQALSVMAVWHGRHIIRRGAQAPNPRSLPCPAQAASTPTTPFRPSPMRRVRLRGDSAMGTGGVAGLGEDYCFSSGICKRGQVVGIS